MHRKWPRRRTRHSSQIDLKSMRTSTASFGARAPTASKRLKKRRSRDCMAIATDCSQAQTSAP
eukprot:2816595-Karenia_brevis.AAC.1